MEKKLKVLMLEDMPEDAELVCRTLKKDGLNFEYLQVDEKDEFINALKTYRPDIILSDHALPQFNSMEALKECSSAALKVPFILVTGTVSEEFAVACLKQGANDYILKSNLSRLPAAIQSALNQQDQESEREKAEQELRLQNEELERMNKEMDSFVYSVSHNLRAPLKSLLGLINLATHDDTHSDGHYSKYFSMMCSSIGKLDETLKEILDYYRNARVKIERQQCDLKKMVEECFDKLKYLQGIDTIKKSIVIKEAHPFYCDRHRLSMVLTNLLSNSIKFRDTNKEKCTINIQAEITKEKVTLSVEDNGVGIEPRFINSIFNMFFRATEKHNGAGLGLYIAKETVEKLRGKITVQSHYGLETRFHIRLPNYHEG